MVATSQFSGVRGQAEYSCSKKGITMSKQKQIEQMALSELNAYSAQLYGQLYAVKSEIKSVQQWRNYREAELDAERNVAAAQARLDEAKAITVPPMSIHAESIKSDEGFGKLGGDVKKWIVKTFQSK